jgi:RNA polymerase primary sigma factor
MIAVVEPKHLGLQTIDASFLLPEVMLFRDELETSDRLLIENLLREPVEFMDNPLFHDPICEQEIVESFDAPPAFDPPEGYLYSFDLFLKPDCELTRFKPLAPDQEAQLFIKMNYARYRVYRLVKDFDNHKPTSAMIQEIIRWLKIYLMIRSQITQANLPLVLAMVKRTKMASTDFPELISEGNLTLLRSVDKFDTARGFKFSTYACRGILKSFARIAHKAANQRRHFPVTFDPDLETSTYLEEHRQAVEINCLERVRYLLTGGNSQEILTPIEKQVLMARFGFNENGSEKTEGHMTLVKVGELVGVSKERARQIQNNGLKKLHGVLEEYTLTC